MEQNQLLGTWKLISWVNHNANGIVTFPFGEDAQGRIIYSTQGYMSVCLTTKNQSHFESDDLFCGSLEEKRNAAESFVFYCGTYEIDGNHVVHHIELSSFANWSGTDLKRLYVVKEDRLILQTSPQLMNGTAQTAELKWERIL